MSVKKIISGYRRCKGCSETAIVSIGEVQEKMEEYLKTIELENCAPREEYNRRLNLCRACPGLFYEATCRYCGCFIQMRAMKKNMNCPYPGGSRW